MLFINTRPADRATQLSLTLRSAGVAVAELPLLELKPRAWSEALAACYAQLSAADVLVVVSPSAVTFGMQGLRKAGISLEQLEHIQWVAVGDATAAKLADYGIHSVVPQVETSEGMLTLSHLEQLEAGACVAFWRGEGGRQFMMQQLLARGIQILNFVLYERHLPEETTQKVKTLISEHQLSSPYCMLITSEASWLNWLDLIQSHLSVLRHAHFLVLGVRLFELLEQSRITLNKDFKIIQLEDLNATHILQHVQVVQGNT